MRSVFLICLTGLLLTACTTPNAGAPVRTSGGPPAPTVVETLSPYQQAALATGTARARLFEEDMRNVERTPLVATQQAGLVKQTATAAAATAQALAIAQVTGTARVGALAR